MANRSPAGFFKHSDGTELNAYAATAAFTTDPIALKGDWICVLQDITVSGGSSPTFDVALQVSYDSGTTWVSFSEDKNSATQASLTQVTATASEFQYFIQPFPEGNVSLRLNVTKSGTWSTMTVNALKFYMRNTSEEKL